ncbi:MAG: hypothetical protein NVSMB65_22010 [Chloroflexota bacterium]
MRAALQLVFERRGYRAGGVLAAFLTAALYAYAGQIVTVYADGSTCVDLQVSRLVALMVLALLMGLVLPVQVFALRRAAWGVRQGGVGVLGFVAGLGSLTCCSPLLLPSVLALVGVSGSSLLSLNVTFYRYFVPLAVVSAVLLLLSLVLASRDITRACALAPGPRASRERGGARPPPPR